MDIHLPSVRSFALGAFFMATAMMSLCATAAEPAATTQVAVGQAAPDFTLPGLGDESYTLSALRGETYAVLVFFRGAW